MTRSTNGIPVNLKWSYFFWKCQLIRNLKGFSYSLLCLRNFQQPSELSTSGKRIAENDALHDILSDAIRANKHEIIFQTCATRTCDSYRCCQRYYRLSPVKRAAFKIQLEENAYNIV